MGYSLYMVNTITPTGKTTKNGDALAISHYAKGVWKVLAIRPDGQTAWFIRATSKVEALRLADWSLSV